MDAHLPILSAEYREDFVLGYGLVDAFGTRIAVSLRATPGVGLLHVRCTELQGDFTVWPQHIEIARERYNAIAPLATAERHPEPEAWQICDGIESINGYLGTPSGKWNIVLGGNAYRSARPHYEFQMVLHNLVWSHAMSRHTEKRIRFLFPRIDWNDPRIERWPPPLPDPEGPTRS